MIKKSGENGGICFWQIKLLIQPKWTLEEWAKLEVTHMEWGIMEVSREREKGDTLSYISWDEPPNVSGPCIMDEESGTRGELATPP